MRAELTDVMGNYIFTGELYFSTSVGPLRMDALREFRTRGDIVQIMHALWREDELGDQPYDTEILKDLQEEITEMSDEQFLEQLVCTIEQAGRSLEDECYEQFRESTLGA